VVWCEEGKRPLARRLRSGEMMGGGGGGGGGGLSPD